MILTEISSLFSFGTTYFLAQKRLKIPGGGPRCLFFFGHNNGTYTLARMHTHTHNKAECDLSHCCQSMACVQLRQTAGVQLSASHVELRFRQNWIEQAHYAPSFFVVLLGFPRLPPPCTNALIIPPFVCLLSATWVLECETSLTWIIMKLLSGDV